MSSSSSDPFYDFMCRHLSIRERELHVIKEEYAFLQSCGGVTSEDMARLRASIQHCTTQIKEEPKDEIATHLVSLKSMLLEIITHSQTDNINKICRHVKPLLEREGIRTFNRHHATHVRSTDIARVRSVLEKDGIV
jgi:hypothetical protein